MAHLRRDRRGPDGRRSSPARWPRSRGTRWRAISATSTRARRASCSSRPGRACWPRSPNELSDKARVQLEQLGVEVHTGTPVTEIGDGLPASSANSASRRAPFSGPPASPHHRSANNSSAELDRAGRVRVPPRPVPRLTPGDLRRRRPRQRRTGRQAGAGRRAGRQADGRAGGAQHPRAHRRPRHAARFTTPTSARSRPSAGIPPSRNCRSCGSPAFSRGGSGWCCTSIS